MHVEAGVPVQPGLDRGGLVGAVVVADQMDVLAPSAAAGSLRSCRWSAGHAAGRGRPRAGGSSCGGLRGAR
jgi:hypothetical protein